MAEIKLTKNELRIQQNKLTQLQKYLPTLQLKKAMLQSQVQEVRGEMLTAFNYFVTIKSQVQELAPLLGDQLTIDPLNIAKVGSVVIGKDNIAGVEVPVYQSVIFESFDYSLLDTPAWFEAVMDKIRDMKISQIKIDVLERKKRALEHEQREVSKRVNLFEKILIPRSIENIRKIKVYLSDMQLAQVARAKVAKALIEAKKLCV